MMLTSDEKHVIDILGASTAVWAFLTDAMPTIVLLVTLIFRN